MNTDGSPCLFSTFNPSNGAFILVDHVLSFSPSLLHQSINEWEHFFLLSEALQKISK